LKLIGSDSSSRSFMLRCQKALSSTTTSSVSSTSSRTPFSTSVWSMLRWISTLFGNALPSVMSASYTSRRPPSSRISSRMVCPLRCFQIFGLVSTFIVVRVLTTRECWKMCCNIGTWVRDDLLCEVWCGLLGVPPRRGVQILGFSYRHHLERSDCPPQAVRLACLCVASLLGIVWRYSYIYIYIYIKQSNI
jgi:hypothetical protein